METDKRLRGMCPEVVHVEEPGFYDQGDVEISAKVTITKEEIDSAELDSTIDAAARNIGKIELCNILNEIAVEEGMRPTWTPEIMSARASARIRAEQKRKKRKNR